MHSNNKEEDGLRHEILRALTLLQQFPPWT